MNERPKNPRAKRLLALALFTGALAARALADPTANCDTKYPECPIEVETDTIPSTTCTNDTDPDGPVQGPVRFILMTCEDHNEACGSDEGCNLLFYRDCWAYLVTCNGVTKFCVQKDTTVGPKYSAGRKCTYPYAQCGSLPTQPLPSPIIPPYTPPNKDLS